jgi:hypothetical protein
MAIGAILGIFSRLMRAGRKGILGIAIGLVVSATTAAPAAATDLYVDRDAPPTAAPCTIAAPCPAIAEAIDLADNDPLPDTVHVGRSTGAYAENVTVPDSPITLSGGDYNFLGIGSFSVIEGGSAPAVTLAPGTTARTVRGLTLQGGSTGPGTGVTLEAGGAPNVTIENNGFNETSPLATYLNAVGSPVIRGNTITGFDDATNWANGIGMNSAVAPRIVGNTISGIERPIVVFGGLAGTSQVRIADNTVQPSGNDAPSGGGNPGAAGILLGLGAGGEISGNLIIPGIGLNASAAGVYFSSDGPGSRSLSRNRIFAFPGNGVRAETTDPVTLNGDVIADNAASGISLTVPGSNAVATNATVWNNDASPGLNGEILLDEMATLVLDSTIVGDDGVRATIGTPSCTAIFSRGPAGSQRCQGQFATNATPSFVNAATRDFHLTPTSNATLIDMGNPAAPAFGVDFDGEARALDGLANNDCAPRRDIGADEVAGLSSDCPPPPSAAPATTAAAVKCPKGKKLVTVKKHGKKKKKCKKKSRKK